MSAKTILRKDFPKVRATKKNGVTRYIVDCRVKEWTGQQRFWLSVKAQALAKAEEIAAKVKADGFNGANEFSQFATNKQLESWSKQLAVRGRSLSDAVGHYLAWLDEQAKKEVIPFFREVLPKWSHYKEADKSKPLRSRSLKEIRTFSKRFARDWGHFRLGEVTKFQVREFLNGMKKKDGTPCSDHVRKAYASLLGQFFNWCVDQELLKENPIKGKGNKVEIQSSIPQIFSIAQCREIMGVIQLPEHRPLMGYVGLCLFSGIRPNEAQQLRWSNLAGSSVLIEPDKSKTKRTRKADISPNLSVWLNTMDRNKPLIPANFKRRLERFIKALAFLWVQDGLRHTFATFWLETHKKREHLAEIMGNSAYVIGKHYVRPVDAKDAEEFWKLVPDAQSTSRAVNP